jgi:hypothetical protein
MTTSVAAQRERESITQAEVALLPDGPEADMRWHWSTSNPVEDPRHRLKDSPFEDGIEDESPVAPRISQRGEEL